MACAGRQTLIGGLLRKLSNPVSIQRKTPARAREGFHEGALNPIRSHEGVRDFLCEHSITQALVVCSLRRRRGSYRDLADWALPVDPIDPSEHASLLKEAQARPAAADVELDNAKKLREPCIGSSGKRNEMLALWRSILTFLAALVHRRLAP